MRPDGERQSPAVEWPAGARATADAPATPDRRWGRRSDSAASCWLGLVPTNLPA